MGSVGITGASGQLGQALMRRWPRAIPIGHRMPDEPVSLLIHAACPDWRDEHAITEFDRFNLAVRQYANTHRPTMVNVGSWWQSAEGDCRDLSYTRLKDRQQAMFPEATHLIAYSIYGPVKGFVQAVVEHLTGGARLTSIGTQWRDFIHVDDVANAVEQAIGLGGTWAAATREPVRVDAVTSAFGIHLPIVEAAPTAELRYPHPIIQTGHSHLHDYIADALADHARQEWDRQRNYWKVA